MYRDREEPDETTEISLEDTQEYRVANTDDEAETEIVEEPEGEFETEEYDDESEYEDDADDEYVEDEYYEDDAYLEDESDEQSDDQVSGESVTGHLKAAGSAFATHVKSIEVPKPRLPNMPKRPVRAAPPESVGGRDEEKVEFEFGLVPGIIVIVIASLVVGVGAFLIGKGSGDDVDTARLEGTADGKQAGAIEGAKKGFATGFQKGRDAGFDKAYIPAYKLNYKRAYEQAGLDVPTDKDFDVPEP